MKFESVDVGFDKLRDPTDYVRLALKAEKYGFGCFWLQEGGAPTWWGPMTLAALILDKTETISVGTGIVSPFKRHPETLASESVTLSQASKGRFVLGMGSGAESLAAFGVRTSQLTGMREATDIVKRLLDGQSFEYKGEVFSYRQPRPLPMKMDYIPPVYLGAMGPKMIEVAYRFADGMVTSRRLGSCPEYLRWVYGIIEGLGGNGKRAFAVRSFVESSVDKDRSRAYHGIRHAIATHTIPRIPEYVLDKTGVEPKKMRAVLQAIRSGGSDLEALIDEDLVRHFSMSGTPEDCVEKLESLQATGLKTPILYFHGETPEKALDMAGREILPLVT